MSAALNFVAEHVPKVVELFGKMPAPQGPLDLHPEPATARVLAEVSRLPAGIYVCAEPSGCGKTSTFELAAAKVNGLKCILNQAFPDSAGFDRSLLRHLGVNTDKGDYATVFAEALALYGNIVGDGAAVGTKEHYVAVTAGTQGLTKLREMQKCSFVLKQPTLVIDDAHRLIKKSITGFDDFIQFVRDPAFQRNSLKVILLSSEMDFEEIVRNNVSGMSTRLSGFRMPRGSLGDLREHMVRQLKDKERMAALLRKYPQLRDAGEPEAQLWLSIAGDNLASISTLIEGGVRTRAEAELWLKSETRVLRGSSSALLRALAAAGEDATVPPGSEVIRVAADSPDDLEAQEWQRKNILRRDTDAEDAIAVDGQKLYTWHRPTLRLSAALAFDRKFRPLDATVPPVLPPVEAVPIAVP